MLATAFPVPSWIPLAQVALTLLRTVLRIVSRCFDVKLEEDNDAFSNNSSINASFLNDALAGRERADDDNSGWFEVCQEPSRETDRDGYGVFDAVDMAPSFAEPPQHMRRGDEGIDRCHNNDCNEVHPERIAPMSNKSVVIISQADNHQTTRSTVLFQNEEDKKVGVEDQLQHHRHQRLVAAATGATTSFYSLSQHESIDQLYFYDDTDRIHRVMLEKAETDQKREEEEGNTTDRIVSLHSSAAALMAAVEMEWLSAPSYTSPEPAP
ncbi:Hypothetical protein, putative [Bodo saltans]|uniref:Uncharacterized protein n=1 Tax=Bodo saltans TaxID=75058 RepID=A0A0S4JD88_BODSA|nr:Hypothetical protein, putative [Bodo saltans]|eukprot:CUG88109.1 Hypothetical protein, putative [Bodo saltans]